MHNPEATVTLEDTQRLKRRELLDLIADDFGGRSNMLQCLGISNRQTFYVWSNKGIPASYAWQIQGITQGRFKASEISEDAAAQCKMYQSYQTIKALQSAICH